MGSSGGNLIQIEAIQVAQRPFFEHSLYSGVCNLLPHVKKCNKVKVSVKYTAEKLFQSFWR